MDGRSTGTSICIDGFNLALPRGSGIATYGRNLATGLRRIGLSPAVLYGPAAPRSADNVANLAAIADGPPPRSRINKNRRWRQTLLARLGRSVHPVHPTDEVIWAPSGGGRPDADTFWSSQDLFSVANRAFQKYRSVTPISFRAGPETPRPEVMHWTCPLPLYARNALNVVTVHDLIPLRLPYSTTDDTSAYMDLCRSSLDRADHVIVVSETTRRDVIELLGVDPAKVTNTYQAVKMPAGAARPQADATTEIEEILGLGWGEYFLYFGAVEPKKNLTRIIEAHMTAKVSRPLVIVGGRGWLDEDETAFLDQIAAGQPDRAERIRRFPYMPFHLLISLIRGARGVVFPSLYEGFGLPVLEAMLLGTPVITSTAGSLPEVAGEAALTVDPYDTVAIRNAIRSLDADDALYRDLVERGTAQARRFSPDAYHQRLVDLYARLGIG